MEVIENNWKWKKYIIGNDEYLKISNNSKLEVIENG